MPPAVDGPRSSPSTDALPPLAALSAHVEALAARGAERRFRAGTLIIQEGERGDTLYIVRSGRLRAFVADNSGKELTLGLYGPGEYVGEMSLDGGPRSASVEAAEATVCALISREDLLAYIAEQPAFALELMARLIRRARLATDNARSMALVDVYGRLTRLLDQLAEPPDADGARAARAPDAPANCQPFGLLARNGQPAAERPGKRRLRGPARAPAGAAQDAAGALVALCF